MHLTFIDLFIYLFNFSKSKGLILVRKFNIVLYFIFLFSYLINTHEEAYNMV